MKWVARHGGVDHEVEVRELAGDEGVYEVTLGETTYRVNSADAGGLDGDGLKSLILDGVQHEVAVRREPQAGGGGAYHVSADTHSETVDVVDPLTHLARTSRGGAGAGGAQEVKAYMPGRVVAVLAAEGDEVAEGQGVVVLEAMKMENEIVAEQAGTLTRIHVEPGQAVEGGDPLFRVE